MTGKKKKRGITPWKKTALKVCVLWLLAAAGIHGFRLLKAYGFEDQREASRWGAAQSCAQVSAFLPAEEAMKEENIQELEYKINSSLAQDSIKLTAEGKDAKLWQDCYSGIGSLTLAAGSKTVTVEAVGTGGAFFTFHPLELSAGTYYLPDSIMKDEILLDQETAWKLFGAFNVEGRTVRVQDMYLRIAGVYKKETGSLYQKAGLADYVVFVQYKTLLQYGGSEIGTDQTDRSDTKLLLSCWQHQRRTAIRTAIQMPVQTAVQAPVQTAAQVPVQDRLRNRTAEADPSREIRPSPDPEKNRALLRKTHRTRKTSGLPTPITKTPE